MSQSQAFAALRQPAFRGLFLGSSLAMMADSIEHVISYWIIFEKFQSPALGGFAVRVALAAVPAAFGLLAAPSPTASTRAA